MRPLVTDTAVTIQKEASGAVVTDITSDTFTVAASGTSEIANYIFNFSSTFDEASTTEGLWKPRFFLQNMPKLDGLTVQYELNASTPEHGTGALSSGAEMPYVYSPVENFTKGTYYDATDDDLKYLKVQMTAGTGAAVYDTADQDGADPLLIVDINRQSTGFLDYANPNYNSDHLFDFSEVNFYIEWPVVFSGTTYTHRHWIGWTSDEDSTINMNIDRVNFKKGKPMGTVVEFLSELQGTISGNFVSMDPWVLKQFGHFFANTSNDEIVLDQRNTQRPLPTYSITMEWFDNTQHLKRFILPKAELFISGEMTPGGGEISKCAFEIVPLVTQNSTLYTLQISKSPVQRIKLPIAFSVTA